MIDINSLPSLYSVTGNIKDINTLLISRAEAVRLNAQAVPDLFVPQTCPHCNETWLMEAPQPLTDEQIADDYFGRSEGAVSEHNRLPVNGSLDCFRAGVRFAERKHLGVKND